MPPSRIPLSDVDLGAEEREAVLRVLESRWLSMGAETQTFEQEFAELCGARHALAVSNGTAGLHLALLALGIGPGDAVLQPAVNFVASANMTAAVGATPCFVDICGLDEPAISPEALRAMLDDPAVTNPRAVIVMHYGGYPCRMGPVREICAELGLALIEDACHAVGGSLADGERVGALGDVAAFSFFGNKNLVTAEGGMVTTDRDDVAEQVRVLRSHGMTSLSWDRHRGHAATYDVVAHGYNYRMDDIRSAFGRVQLKKLPASNARRRELTQRYWERIEPLTSRGWTLPFRGADTGDTPSCHLMVAVAPDADARWRYAEALKEAGIQTSLHYPYIPAFTGFKDKGYPEAAPLAKEYCARVLTLPLFPTMAEEQVDTVADRLLACG